MARIRTVKPETFEHEVLFDAEKDSGLPLRVAWIGLWTMCDRDGRFMWRPRQLKSNILPYDDLDFERVLDALWTHGFLVKYASDGNTYGCIPSWHKHQFINNKERLSEIPPPTNETLILIGKTNMSGTREERVNDAPIPFLSPSLPIPIPSSSVNQKSLQKEFEEVFWPKYPNKVGKAAALKSFRAARDRFTLETLMIGLSRYVIDKPPDRQWCNPTTWLNQDRCLDEPASVAATMPRATRNDLAIRNLRERAAHGNIVEFGRPQICNGGSQLPPVQLSATGSGSGGVRGATDSPLHRTAEGAAEDDDKSS
jgi:hypothetical protein